jgi:hypothetical protein
MFFLLFLLNDRRIRGGILIHISDQWIRIQEAQKHMDPLDSDPDPQHCFFCYSSTIADISVRIQFLGSLFVVHF